MTNRGLFIRPNAAYKNSLNCKFLIVESFCRHEFENVACSGEHTICLRPCGLLWVCNCRREEPSRLFDYEYNQIFIIFLSIANIIVRMEILIMIMVVPLINIIFL